MSKVMAYQNQKGEHEGFMVFCPACKCGHGFDKRWTFNGDFEKPTFSPSMMVRHNIGPNENAKHVCHSWVRDGMIQFLNDCTHTMAGQAVPMEDF